MHPEESVLVTLGLVMRQEESWLVTSWPGRTILTMEHKRLHSGRLNPVHNRHYPPLKLKTSIWDTASKPLHLSKIPAIPSSYCDHRHEVQNPEVRLSDSGTNTFLQPSSFLTDLINERNIMDHLLYYQGWFLIVFCTNILILQFFFTLPSRICV